MGFFDFLKTDSKQVTETSDDDPREEETESWPKYRSKERTAEKTLQRYEYDLGNGETIQFDQQEREDNHIEFYDRNLQTNSNRFCPIIQEKYEFIAALPLDNIDGVFEPDVVDETTYKVTYTTEERQRKEGYAWHFDTITEVGDIEVVDE